ncbi:MAG TPA: hypothetical protein VN836_09030, partial [Verrucomicrobiae bacterium]|nr:hypothetical protein [Verrucomicrobiae bacterium]
MWATGQAQSADAFPKLWEANYFCTGSSLRNQYRLNVLFHRMKTPHNSRRSIACQRAAGVLGQADTELGSLTDWIQLIHQVWIRGANRTLELSRLMNRARQSLPYGSWSRLLQSGGLPFSRRKGEMLVVVGQGVGGLNAQNSAQLP